MLSKTFALEALERALKTFAQALVSILTVGAVGASTAPWGHALDVAALAAVLSIVTSLASYNIGEPASPSLVKIGEPVALPADDGTPGYE